MLKLKSLNVAGKVDLSSHNSGTRRPRAILLAVLLLEGPWFYSAFDE
jgi:hypothetical protein